MVAQCDTSTHAEYEHRMRELPHKKDIEAFRAFLDANDYTPDRLRELLGTTSPPAPGSERRFQYLTREATTTNALIRLFLLGGSIAGETVADVLPDAFVELCSRAGLVESGDDRLRATVVITAVDDLLFASDALRLLGTDEARNFVLPANTHAANYLRHLTIRDDVESALDLGCGSGVHALLAARHSDKVTATDISDAAIRYTTFNALLNGIDNVECLRGNLFEPVAGRTFDLIISNPPFVLGPDEAFEYRDNPLDLDDFCRQIVVEASNHLGNGGLLQMLCESVEHADQPWADRIRSWYSGTGCDAWILHGRPLHPVHYVAQRQSDISGENVASGTAYDEWVSYLEDRGVVAVHGAMLASRKRDGDNWFHVHHFPDNIDEDAAGAVRRGIRNCDFLEQCSDDATLLDAVLTIAPDLSLMQQFSWEDGQWRPDSSLLRLAGALPMDAEVDVPILAFLNQIDGRSNLRTTLEQFSGAVNADKDKLSADLLPIVRLFIGRGFMLPVESRR